MHPEVTRTCVAAKAVILEACAKHAGTRNSQPEPPALPLPLASIQVPDGTTHQAVAIHRVTRAGVAIAVAARAGAQVGPPGHPGEVGVTALTGQAGIADGASAGTEPRLWLQGPRSLVVSPRPMQGLCSPRPGWVRHLHSSTLWARPWLVA